jgi:predicted HTH domain antitoxin
MNIQVTLDDKLVHGRNQHDMQTALYRSLAVSEFVEKSINLTELAQIFGKDHIDMIVWLKERGINTPSIQGYSENGFTQDTEERILKAAEEARSEVNVSKRYDSAEEFLADLHQE